MTRQEKINSFNPNDAGNYNNNIFGLPFNSDESEVVIIPVPWEVTVSYRPGTANGPEAIKQASYQIDLFDPVIPDAWKLGISMEEIDQDLLKRSNSLREEAEAYLELLSLGMFDENDPVSSETISKINEAAGAMVVWVKERCLQFLNKDKIVATLGGDHSTPLGLIQALSEKYNSFSILQLDAHADLRNAYEGFEFSHASIMYNALKIKNLERLVQVGIRDYCQEEVDLINNSGERIKTFFDRDIKQRIYTGENLSAIYASVIEELGENVYISFDIDALDPKLCPNTGTPVPGGFEYDEALFLIEMLASSGKKIIGFDLNEVAPGDDELDANIAGRLLYHISNLAARSQNRI